jgi:hypothetical protein
MAEGYNGFASHKALNLQLETINDVRMFKKKEIAHPSSRQEKDQSIDTSRGIILPSPCPLESFQ